MAVTENLYTGNGSTTTYSFTFPYLETTDIKVSVNGTPTTAYTLATATTIQFNTAPVNGAAIRIYRVTDDSALAATFYSGSAIRSSDLNDNFTQNLYVTQESTNNAGTALTTANTALTNSATALSQSNTAISDSATALSQSNTAISDSATALSQSNTAISDSASAVSTANTAASNASTALSQSNTAISDSATALSQSNTAIADSATAISDSATALSTANTALSTANTALSTATTADTNATAALNAIAGTVQYVLVADVSAIPSTPVNGDAIEIADSTGIESFTPLSNLPAGYVGDPGLSVRLQYLSSTSSWNWLNYFANNAETRYFKLAGGTITGNLEIGNSGSLTFEGSTANAFETTVAVTDPTADRTITLPDVSGTVVTTGDTGSVTSTMIADGTIVDADVNASAAIAGTKISPDFGAQNVTTTGTSTAASFIPTSSTAPTNGVYLPAANSVAISTNSTGRLFIDSSGRVGVGTGNPSYALSIKGGSATSQNLLLTWDTDQTNAYARIRSQFAEGNTSCASEIRFHQRQAQQDGGYQTFWTTNSGGTLVEAMRIDSSQRVGIGSSSPGYRLDVDNTNAGTATARLVGNDQSNVRLRIQNNGSGGRAYEIVGGLNGANNSHLSIYDATAASTRLTITETGAVGIGTASPGGKLAVYDASAATFRLETPGVIAISHSFNGTDYTINNNDGSNGHPIIFGTKTSGQESARIDSSGRLLVGTSTSTNNARLNQNLAVVAAGSGTYAGVAVTGYSGTTGWPLVEIQRSRGASDGTMTVVASGDRVGELSFRGADGTNFQAAASIAAEVDGTPGANDMPGRLVFSTTADGASSPTERVRITQAGYWKASSTNSYFGGNYHEIRSGNSDVILAASNTNSSPFGLEITYTAVDPNGTSNNFLRCYGSNGGALRADIRSNGGFANYQANDVNLSDRNVKKDISPAANTWDCIKAWEIVNYRYKDQPDDADLNLGVIAQQVAESCPEVITVFQEAKDDQPEKLGVKEQQMYWMAIKALQEAQVRIETLEAEVAALRAQ